MNNEKELYSISLPKWPEMRVEGNSISEDQAAEIILRTAHTSRSICLNDKEWESVLIKTLKMPKIKDECYKLEDNEYQKEIKKSFMDSLVESASKGATQGANIGGAIGSLFGKAGEAVGRTVGGVVGGIVGGISSFFGW